jgi:hypothetical protein
MVPAYVYIHAITTHIEFSLSREVRVECKEPSL